MVSPFSSMNGSLREQSVYLSIADNSVIHKAHSSLRVQALACLEQIINIAKNIFTFLALVIRESYDSLINRVKRKNSQKLTEAQVSIITPETSQVSPSDSTSRRNSLPKPTLEDHSSPIEPPSIEPPSPSKEPVEFKEEKRDLENERTAYIHRDSIERSEEYIWHKRFILNFINKNPEDPFRQLVKARVGEARIGYAIENLDLQAIEVPNKAALELQALKYAEKYRKYEVNIKITHIDQLDIVVDELQRESRKPRYVGIIVGDETFEGHVLPLLCYFNPHSKNEFLILDVNAENGILLAEVPTKLKTKVTEPEKDIIVYTGPCRQADAWSCRTGALNLLCNALLSLKHYQQENGFIEALRGCFYESSRLIKIPADWAIYEQIFQGEGEKEHIRDLVSNNPEKRARPRTVAAVRESHKQNVRMKYTLFIEQDDAYTSYLAQLRKLPTPPGVEFDVNRNQISFEETIRINTYLARKAARRKRELEATVTIPTV